MDRVAVFKSHLRLLEGKFAVAQTVAALSLTKAQLESIALYLELEMDRALLGEPSTLPMIPTYVTKPKGSARSGVMYAFDLGGTNFRALRLVLNKAGEVVSTDQVASRVPEALMNGNADDLFDFLASCAKKLVEKHKDTESIPVGFTFSFPTKQRALDDGELLTWTKGYSTSGMEGKNVVELMQVALVKQHLSNLKIVALCNDTVGTLIARYLRDDTAQVGAILGTGSNACYWESTSRILKEPKIASGPKVQMVINIEWGNLGSTKNVAAYLPVTKYDVTIDAASPNNGKQRFEKMISGMYLGEIARLALTDIFGSASPFGRAFAKPGSFSSKALSEAVGDDSVSLNHLQLELYEEGKVDITCLETLRTIKTVCIAVRDRSAALSACAIAAMLRRSRTVQKDVTVAIDGSVFEKIPGYKAQMLATMKSVFNTASVNLVLSKDGSGVGAGMIAAIA